MRSEQGRGEGVNKEQWIKKVKQLGFTVVKTRGDYLEAELRDLKIWTLPTGDGIELASAASFRFNYHYVIKSCFCLTVEDTLESLLSEINRTMQNVQYEVTAIAKMLAKVKE